MPDASYRHPQTRGCTCDWYGAGAIALFHADCPLLSEHVPPRHGGSNCVLRDGEVLDIIERAPLDPVPAFPVHDRTPEVPMYPGPVRFFPATGG